MREKMEDKNTLSLIKRAKNKDNEAIQILIEKNIGLIHKINFKFGNTEDGVQEGILGVYNAIEKFDESYRVKFSTYAYHNIKKYIMDNYYREIYKTSIHFTRLIKDGKINYEGQVELPEVIESKEDVSVEDRIFIEKLIQKCSFKEKEFIHKIYYEGKKESEVAKELNISRQAVNNYKNHILQKLRCAIENPRNF